MLSIFVNGVEHRMATDPRTPLLYVLREGLGLRGTKYGCGEGECGACTVVVDGRTICSCLATIGAMDGAEITTIEGLSNDAVGARLFNLLADKGAIQCGFCTPGFVLSGWQAVVQGGGRDEAAIRDALSGNLCRCTGYARIVEALKDCVNDPAPSPLATRKGQERPAIKQPHAFWRPADLDDLLANLADFSARPTLVAGGTDVLVQHEHGLEALAIVDISSLAELKGIRDGREVISIGAATTWTEIRRSELLAYWAPLLPLAAAEIGGIQIQNCATIGGNLGNASPAADGIPALHVHGALVELGSTRGRRIVPVSEFMTGPHRTVAAPDEVILAVRVPKAERKGTPVRFFEKAGARKAQTITKASVAFLAWRDGDRLVDPRIALGAVGPTIVIPAAAQAMLATDCSPDGVMAAASVIRDEVTPIDDIRSTADHRRCLAAGLLTRGFWKCGVLRH